MRVDVVVDDDGLIYSGEEAIHGCTEHMGTASLERFRSAKSIDRQKCFGLAIYSLLHILTPATAWQ